MSDTPLERAPLLQTRRNEAAESGPTESGDTGLPRAALLQSFKLATTTSLIAGGITMLFLVISAILMGSRPREYRPPYSLSYHFATAAGFSIIAMLHSAFTLARLKASDELPSRAVAGILVDVLAGLYFLFQSLYGAEQFVEGPDYAYFGCSPSTRECEDWRARAEPVIWCFLLALFVFGLAHAVLLFLRASMWKRGNKELRVRLVDRDGNDVRA